MGRAQARPYQISKCTKEIKTSLHYDIFCVVYSLLIEIYKLNGTRPGSPLLN